MKKKTILAFTCLFALTACGPTSSSTDSSEIPSPSDTTSHDDTTLVPTYEVIFKNYDDSILYKDFVAEHLTAEYKGEIPTKPATEQYNYTFTGWDKSLENIIADTVFTAQYEEALNEFTVTWVNDNGDVLETDENVKYGEMPTYDKEEPKSGESLPSVFKGWSPEISKVTKDVTYTAQYDIKFTKGDTFTFGMYPQTRITFKSTVDELNKLAIDLPNKDNANTWISYKYYALKKNNVDYMWYKDVKLNEKMYRGVYFDQYRPMFTTSSSSEGNSLQDNNGYLVNTVHWFEYEPITWTCLDDHGLVLSETILDSQVMYHNADKYKLENDDVIYNTNNYEMSEMRHFLNNDFFNASFTDAQKETIKLTTIKNDLASTGDVKNQFTCNDTQDKVFLLSKADVLNPEYGFENDESRMAQCSDYAACMGAFIKDTTNTTHWWTRTPDATMSYRSYHVDYSGILKTWNVYGQSHAGVRPAIHF